LENQLKAFLSYSHRDKALVDAVAAHVGRIFVTVDTVAFHTSDDIIQSIESAIKDSGIFVYFASNDSIGSNWVRFEIDEARYHQLISRLRRFIIVLLDDRLQPTAFPEWMQRHILIKSHAPRPIARIIRGAIDDMVAEDQSGIFVGRASETANLQAALVPPNTLGDVSVVTIRGLPGIGRRTLLQRVAKDSLFIERLLTVRVEIGDNVNSITAKLADLIEPAVTTEDTLGMVRQIQSLSASDACSRFVSDVSKALQLHELVVLYDEGGALDDDGSPTTAIRMLLRETRKPPAQLIALITNRRPRFRDVPDLQDTDIVDVSPLREPEVRQLVALRARAKGFNFTPEIIAELAEQAKGYPPAVTALVEMAKVYGAELAANSLRNGADYRPQPLTRYLSKLRFSPAEQKMISILARNSPLPLSILAHFVPDVQDATRALTRLIDTSLVMPQLATSWYRISDPVIDYVDRQFPPCTVEDYSVLANELDKFLGKDRDAGSYLDLSRVLYRALIHAGRTEQPRAYALLADWLRLAEEFYHQRNYQRALSLAMMAHKEAPGSETLTWIIRSHVKLGNFDRALSYIEEMRTRGHPRDVHFLIGFLERNRGAYRAAIRHYELAMRAGRRGLALERDLAECYLQEGDLDRATLHIEAAQARQPDNPYVLSLRIRIACRQGHEETARRLLSLLHEVDSQIFASHRQSRVELAFGNIDRAYEYAMSAVSGASRPPAEALANLAHCQILTHRFSDGIMTIANLESLYGNRWGDVMNGLRARAAIAQEHYEEALDLCELLVRENNVHAKLKYDALEGLLRNIYLPPDQRLEKERLLADLKQRLAVLGNQPKRGADFWDAAAE
jgi:pentatricopeptide repeat protein